LAFQPFVIPLFAVDDPAAVLHPDACGDLAIQAAVFQGAFGAADQFGHSLFGDLVDVTGAFDIHGMVSTPPVAAGWWSGVGDRRPAAWPVCFVVGINTAMLAVTDAADLAHARVAEVAVLHRREP
jgi:hypothetical protein